MLIKQIGSSCPIKCMISLSAVCSSQISGTSISDYLQTEGGEKIQLLFNIPVLS